MNDFNFTIESTDGFARAGTLNTPHGSVETPCFMAVGTQGGLKGVSVSQAEEANLGIMLSNTYHLALRPSSEVVHKLGGLHKFSGWSGPMLTDSGGYQVFSLAQNRKITEEGVAFKSHIDGAKFMLSPEESIRIQRFLGADIIMAFDECPSVEADKKEIDDSLERTIRWLERSKNAWLETENGYPNGAENQVLYGIIQGGLHKELREKSLKLTKEFDLPGIAVGGLAIGESFDERNMVLDWLAKDLPPEKPHYLMGVGTPLDMLEAIYRGVDQFDCVLPTRMGRHGIAYTDNGPMHLKRAEYAEDTRVIDEETISEASRVSRGYIRHLLKANEMLAGILISIHNIAYYQKLMKRARKAIEEKNYENFLNDFRQKYKKSAD